MREKTKRRSWSIMSIDVRHDEHFRFSKQSVAGALYKKVRAMRVGQSTRVANFTLRDGGPGHIGHLQNAVKYIHKLTRMRLQVVNDPEKMAVALVRRLPNVPKQKSDVTSDSKGDDHDT
jgi:hypothetical protein